MSRYIDSDLLKAEFARDFTKAYATPLIKRIIDQQPTADVEEVRHGKWIYKGHHEMMGHAMPIIGCGLDGLEWDKVSRIIKYVFQEEDVEILVCRL